MDAAIAIALVLFAILGTPLFVIFGAGSMIYFAQDPRPNSVNFAAAEVFTEKFADSPMMVTLPLFIFAGYILAESGAPKRLVRLAGAWFSWLPGGLAIVCILASAFFTTFTGGSGITIVAVGGLLFPALIAEKYPERFSLGLVTAGGSLGLLFPPSLPLILYGIVAGLTIEKLFLAGFIPGVLTLLLLALYAVFFGARQKKLNPGTTFVAVLKLFSIPLSALALAIAAFIFWETDFAEVGLLPKLLAAAVLLGTPTGLTLHYAKDRREALDAAWEAKWEIALPVVLVVGLVTGSMRIHEAAAFAAIYALVIEVWIYKDVSFRKDLTRIIRDSTTMFGAILAILATAIGFTGFLITADVPAMALDWLSEVISGPFMFLLLLNVFLLVVGMLMDIFSAIVVVVPLIVPIAVPMGIDPYHLAIIFLLNLEIGYLTPPVGLNLFISSFRFNKPVTLLYRAVLPFIGLLIVALLFTTYIEWLAVAPTQLDSTEEIHLEDTPMPVDDVDGGAGDLMDEIMGDDDMGEFNLDDLEGDMGDDEFNLDDLENEADGPPSLDEFGGGDTNDDEPTLDDLEYDLGIE